MDPASTPDLFETLVAVRREGLKAALATVIGTRGSTPGKSTMRLLVIEDGRRIGTVGGGCVEADVIDLALDVMETGRARRSTFRLTERETGATGLMCGGELEVFIEDVTSPGLVLFGAGHISRDLCEIAARAGFRVTVVDDRESFANRGRFPAAAEVIAAPDFDAAFGALHVRPTTSCVVVTRGHAMDLQCTAFALSTTARYVGLIGSKIKIKALLRRMRDEGQLEGVDLSRLHAPIGLDLGGGSAGEIAVAIVAELIATRHERDTSHTAKRLSDNEIHAIVGGLGAARSSEGSEDRTP